MATPEDEQKGSNYINLEMLLDEEGVERLREVIGELTVLHGNVLYNKVDEDTFPNKDKLLEDIPGGLELRLGVTVKTMQYFAKYHPVEEGQAAHNTRAQRGTKLFESLYRHVLHNHEGHDPACECALRVGSVKFKTGPFAYKTETIGFIYPESLVEAHDKGDLEKITVSPETHKKNPLLLGDPYYIGGPILSAYVEALREVL